MDNNLRQEYERRAHYKYSCYVTDIHQLRMLHERVNDQIHEKLRQAHMLSSVGYYQDYINELIVERDYLFKRMRGIPYEGEEYVSPEQKKRLEREKKLRRILDENGN